MGDIVIGSGPAGVSAAMALAGQGRAVTLIDAGERIEPENAALRSRLAAVEPVEWDEGDVAALLRPLRDEQTDLMRPFGSEFPFRDPYGLFGAAGPPRDVELRPSFATGGLSNGWGASVLPYRSEDLVEWPIDAADLAPDYAAVRDFMPIAARSDELQRLFPALEIEEDTSLPPSSQAAELLARLDGAREQLARLGLHFGQSRVAVASRACRRCRMCLFGCPYQAIFHAGSVLERLRERPGFEHREGLYATRFEESEAGVRVLCRSTSNGEELTLQGDRLFVGCGVLPTAQLVLRSLDHYDERVPLLDSQHFHLPMLQTWRRRGDPASESLHALTQLFVELIDPEIDRRTVHFQLYTHNDFYASDMRKRLGRAAFLASPLIGWMSRRLIVAQGFLHSDVSPSVEMALSREGDAATLRLAPIANPEVERVVARARGRLARALGPLGLRALTPLSRLGAVGSSFHCGGSFPMRESPVGLESDTLGRPAGLARVHLIDASVFPSIPATTITLSVMANAHRIARRAV